MMRHELKRIILVTSLAICGAQNLCFIMGLKLKKFQVHFKESPYLIVSLWSHVTNHALISDIIAIISPSVICQ